MDNFETLAGQLEEIYDSLITNTEQLTKLVTLIFEKTVQEHVYGPLYAKLCVTLSSKEKGFDEMVRTDYGMETIQVDFKNVLVKVCQTEFQKGKRPPQFTSDMDAQDRENEKIKVKKILLGTMKFIGQLYLSELLPPRVMTLCLKHLIIPSGQKPSDDDVEAACTLLSTVGPALDEDKNLKKQELNKYYQRLASVSKNSSYSQRIRIVIQNLNDLRKKGWTDSRAQKAEGPKRLDKSKKASRVAMRLGDDDDVFMMGMEQFIGQGGDDALEMIHADVVPIASHVVGQSERNLNKRGRYGGGAGQRVSDDKRSVGRRRNPRNTGGRWKLLDSKEDEEQTGYSEEVSMDMDYGGGGGYDNAMEAQPAVSGVGRRKHRTALSANTSRPCDDGKVPDEDKLNDIMGDYYEMKANEETTISSLVMYQIADREKFLLSNIRRAIDNRKGERLSQLIPKLLDEYIVVASELDGAFIEFFKGYTMEDNPQINKYAPQLLANLLVDKELDFSDLLGWILLDTREAQPQDDMLQFYDKDGIRNCIRGSKTITKALDLLGYLFKELKEVCFEDQEYVKKLLIAHNFEIDKYMDQSDLANKAAVEEEWIDKYKLKFAF